MSEPGSSIIFNSGRTRLDRPALRAFALRLSQEVAGGRSFTTMITRDPEMQSWNRAFLGHNYPTDVLSFPWPEKPDSIGDVGISVDRAREQALEHGHHINTEIQILMLHAVLHLIGMDHENDRGRMRRAEIKWRKAFGLPCGLLERVRT